MLENQPTIESLPLQLRRSVRQRKLNPKYANIALVEDKNELKFYEEAF